MPDPSQPDRPDKPFSDMAARIAHNADDGFGGAFVVVPPTGEPLSTLILDPAQNASTFWATLKTKAEIALAELEQKERAHFPAGYR